MGRTVIHDIGSALTGDRVITWLSMKVWVEVLWWQDNSAQDVAHRRGQQGFFTVTNLRIVWVFTYIMRVNGVFCALWWPVYDPLGPTINKAGLGCFNLIISSVEYFLYWLFSLESVAVHSFCLGPFLACYCILLHSMLYIYI